MAHVCKACGGAVAPPRRVLRAAFGMAIPEGEEDQGDRFSDATHFNPKPYFFAKGGKIPDVDLGRKREADLPDEQLPVYRGENAKQARRAAEREAASADVDRAHARFGNEPDSDEEERLAYGGRAKLGSGRRFQHLTHQLEGRGDVKDPKALAATIGRRELGAARFNKLAERGRARAEHHAEGGESGSFAIHAARRARVLSRLGGR